VDHFVLILGTSQRILCQSYASLKKKSEQFIMNDLHILFLSNICVVDNKNLPTKLEGCGGDWRLDDYNNNSIDNFTRNIDFTIESNEDKVPCTHVEPGKIFLKRTLF